MDFVLQSRFESHYLYTGDYQLNGHVERTATARNVEVNVLKNSQPLARLQAIVPKHLIKWTGDEEKHVRNKSSLKTLFVSRSNCTSPGT